MRLILLLTVVLASCAADEGGEATADATSALTPGPTAASPHPSHSLGASPSDASGATLRGTLGVADIEGGCAYLQAADGTRWEIIYPTGWRARANPLQLVDPDGVVVARAGATITVHGREARDAGSICQIGPIFKATEVVSVEAR